MREIVKDCLTKGGRSYRSSRLLVVVLRTNSRSWIEVLLKVRVRPTIIAVRRSAAVAEWG